MYFLFLSKSARYLDKTGSDLDQHCQGLNQGPQIITASTLPLSCISGPYENTF